MSNQEDQSALEQFRQKWRAEVSARTKQNAQLRAESSSSKPPRRESVSRVERPINRPPGPHPLADVKDEDGYEDGEATRSGLIERIEGLRTPATDEDDFSDTKSNAEPRSALEHYERAVEKESQGNLGDSLSHYRKAYRLDAKVDQSYKNKHFPRKPKQEAGASSQLSGTHLSTVDDTADEPAAPKSFDELITSYADCSVPGAKPIIPGDKEPPCPVGKLPTEVLIELFQHVAIRDPAVYVRLALVCKRFAYHVMKENSIWKRVALGPEFGLASQQYNFATDVQGRDAIWQTVGDDLDPTEQHFLPVTDGDFTKGTDYREVFHSHPRVRFSGIYISTVNYTRPGGVSASPGNWSSNVHIVTYYRYLRFFRDGTLISLLTTNEPLEVVHHLTKENLALVRPLSKNLPPGLASGTASKDGQTVPVAIQNFLKHALRGRWRLCHPSLTDPSEGLEVGANHGVHGDLHIETEGAASRYTYTMHLALKPGSRSRHATKNNKLLWKGFWKYNTLTDDWAEFHLRNDKAFFFSRVKSYGLGY